MEVEAKIKEDMKKLGCTCEKQLALAFHLYIYLVDKKLMYDTEYCYNKDIDKLYIVARTSKHDKLNIYVPVPTDFSINMGYINQLQENLCTVETGPGINLAFIETDFTVVIYTFTKGILDRPSVERMDQIKRKQEQRKFINSELKKKKDTIVKDALDGGDVDD
ncbi:uncharacterized protein LOC126978149 [Leptidea sinapis]|uniref:tRNA-splicing endonuclease subunit Sen15 domain-containing protein n=1 Tax=Leptidea sinapis TaxID=189913 RepID=A0A5E4QBJ5_9NEOP|nr:uncharacterized protein LOC126978149 [Leptidea sinapis]VVC94801.1 unnamed protein product [Leptidea sinapis]